MASQEITRKENTTPIRRLYKEQLEVESSYPETSKSVHCTMQVYKAKGADGQEVAVKVLHNADKGELLTSTFHL